MALGAVTTPTMAVPLISVIVPTRNSLRTLSACLKSVRNQTYSRVELIVVDNFSTDGSDRIGAAEADVFIKAGPERSAQRNLGAKAAKGEYVLIIDSDMVLSDDVVADCVEIATSANCVVAIPEVSIGEGYWARCKAYERSFYVADATIAAARFFPRSTFLMIGGYDESLYAGEDWDLSIRASRELKLVFSRTMITHDEGRLSYVDQIRKKYYYGLNLPVFIHKHRNDASARLTPLRGSLYRNLRAIISRPILGVGVIALKAAEMISGCLGIIVGAVRLRRIG